MSSESNVSVPPTVDHKPHAAFFRQSGWMMTATIFAGMLTFGLHFLNKKISDADYTIFVTLMTLVTCVPTIPLQMVFAQQAAEALAVNRERQLAGMIRLAWVWTFILWFIAFVAVLVFQRNIVNGWQLGGSTGLWLTMPAVLVSLWMPLFSGVLQGRQDFFWLGWLTILGGGARVAVAAAIVFLFSHPSANSLVIGVMCGIGVAAVIGIWRTRDLWSMPSEPFNVKESLGKIVPLMIGFGAAQFMFASDTMFAKAFFDNDAMKPYGVAGTLSRALLWLVMPLAAVMFPKLVRSHAKSEKTNLFGIVVIGTGVLTACGAVGLCIVGPIVVKIVYKASDVAAAEALLPWYGGAMIPLGLANVLVNDLLARSRFGVVIPMVVLAIVYSFTLVFMLHRYPHMEVVPRMELVLQTLAAFNTILLAICVWFRWGIKDRKAAVQT